MICGWSQLKNQFMIRVFFVSLNYLSETIYVKELKIQKKNSNEEEDAPFRARMHYHQIHGVVFLYSRMPEK